MARSYCSRKGCTNYAIKEGVCRKHWAGGTFHRFGPQVLGYLVILFSSETVSAHATENCVQLFYSDARPQARPQLLVRAHDTPIIT